MYVIDQLSFNNKHLQLTDQAHPGKWLDYRNRGVSGSKKGELVWHFNRLASSFTERELIVAYFYCLTTRMS